MTTDPAARATFIAGLRDLADFLAANPAVAVPVQPVDIHVQPYGTDEDEAREIDAFAAAAGVDVLDQRDSTGHYSGRYSATVTFGSVMYHAFTYTAAIMAKSDARHSYARNVQVDAPAAGLTEIAQAT
jgi:hypothetical protein